MPVFRILTSIVLILCFVSAALAQDQDDKNKEILKKAAENGRPLQVDVNGNVSAEAVLIPWVDARRIFGKEIADNYAVVEVNIGNKSPDATLIIHNVYIDYSRWALSGSTGMGQATVAGVERDKLAPYRASNTANRVASEEYRIVRGQLLDAQPSTTRNRIIKWLSLAGTVAAAYTFSLREQGFIRGISAYNGVVIPGIGATFPDAVIPQLNRVSDFGFQTNKVIPKQGGEVIVCFFPINRFLTPGFRKLFLKSPALFFAPLQMLVDDTMTGYVDQVLGEDLGLSGDVLGVPSDQTVRDVLRKSLPCYLRVMEEMKFGAPAKDDSLAGRINRQAEDTCLRAFGLPPTGSSAGSGSVSGAGGGPTPPQLFARFLALDYLSQASLNNVRVTVDGVMTVDTMSIPAQINEVTFDEVDGCAPNQRCYWTVPADGSGAVRTGTVSGAYLTAGNVDIAEEGALEIKEVKAVEEGSSDQLLHFSMKLTKDVESGKSLTFKVTKPRPGAPGTVDSQPWTYVVGYLNSEVARLFGKVKYDSEARTVTLPVLDPRFNDARFKQLTFSLNKPVSGAVDGSKLSPKMGDGSVVLTIPTDEVAQGCWSVKAMSGTDPVGIVNDAFEVPPPPPTLDAVSIEANEIAVTGTNLIDNRACSDKGLVFELVRKDATKDDKPIRLEVDDEKPKTPTARHLKLPSAAKPDTSWLVQVRRGNDPVDQDHAQKELDIK